MLITNPTNIPDGVKNHPQASITLATLVHKPNLQWLEQGHYGFTSKDAAGKCVPIVLGHYRDSLIAQVLNLHPYIHHENIQFLLEWASAVDNGYRQATANSLPEPLDSPKAIAMVNSWRQRPPLISFPVPQPGPSGNFGHAPMEM